MTWPTVAVTTTNTDAGTDSPATARTDILDLMTKSNQMIAHVSAFAASMLDDASAAAARTTLGAAASGANSDITSLGGLTTALSGAAIGNKIQPITASIAANAITVTLNPTTLDFRNTSLTNGAITNVALASAANLTIAATDSFGAVTADGTRRIAILAINNAGTIELAASSLAGGVNLDEIGVVTTAATATTLAGIKSTTVRTGVAYRVVGFVDATFTTAVGWGSLALVQGAGGNAATAIGSLGYGQTYGANLNATKVVGTTYYNTSGKPKFITVTGQVGGSVNTININGVAIATSSVIGLATGYPCVSAIIPLGASYSITGSVSPSYWYELG